MDDRYLLAWVFALMTLGALVLGALVVLGAIVLRFRGRHPGRRWGTAAVFLFGFMLGDLILFLDSQPITRAVTLAIVGLGVLALLWRDRRVQAGALLAGTALPWTMVWGWYILRMVTGALNAEATTTWALFFAGAVPFAIGIAIMAAGDPLAPDPSPTAPVGKPGSRKVGIVAQTVLAPESIGPVPISEVASFLAEIIVVLAVGAVGIPFPLEAVAQIGLATLAGNAARIVVRPARGRRAYEAFSWLAEWEIERAKRLTGHGAPLTKTTARRWLDQVPDEPSTGWIRIEVLQWLERFDEAQAVAARMPTETPYDRFEQRFAFDSIDWMRGGDGDPGAVRAAANEIDPADEEARLRAEVAMAIRESARIAADRGPEQALEPLLRARELLGERADNQLVRALWSRYLPISFVTAVVTWVILGAVT